MEEEPDEENGEVNAIATVEGEKTEEADDECNMMFLGDTSLNKNWKPHNMRMQAKVNGVPVLLMVDSCATQLRFQKIGGGTRVARGGDQTHEHQVRRWLQSHC